MSKPISKVEIGFDLTATDAGPFFKLDDSERGVLDNEEWFLAGTLLIDVTDRVRSISISRGKNRETDNFDPGLLNVVFDNNDRAFDPTYENSPFYGQVIPKRQIRVVTGTETAFRGVIDDWNLDYSSIQDSTASAAASDAFTFFRGQTLTGGTQIVETTGERINAILDDPSVAWPAENRDIDTGAQILGADVIEDNSNVLSYLQLVEQSEPGRFFIGKNGDVTFRDRTVAATSDGVTLADDGSGIAWNTARVVYGSEQLYNEIVIVNGITGGTAVATDADSQIEYGILNLTRTNLLMETDEAALDLAIFYASKYSQPEYRFESVDVLLNEITPEQADSILALDIGSVVKVLFTPSGIPPAVERFAEVIGVDHAIDTNSHMVTLSFSTLDFASIVLDDAEFGKLNTYSLAF